MSPWRIQLLGDVRAVRGPWVVASWNTQKTALLLAHLALHPDRAHPREGLIELFWPDAKPEAGRNSLSQALSNLRQRLEPPDTEPGSVVVASRTTVKLDADAFTTDVQAFRAALDQVAASRGSDRTRALEAAVGLYSGELLPGQVAEWIVPERERLAASFLRTVRELATEQRRAGALDRATELYRRALAADPLHEESHRDLMAVLAARGEPLSALRHYEDLVRTLDRELAVSPSAPTRALAREIEQSIEREPAPQSARDRTPATSAKRPVTTKLVASSAPVEATRAPERGPGLPLELGRFFGREEELAWLRNEVGPGPRLVTLTGPGGIGKTRLALEAASSLKQAFAGRVFFASLADVTDARLVSEAIARALGLAATREREPLDQVKDALASGPTLLVLDNVEHVRPGASSVVRTLLESGDRLACLATSHVRLGISGERELPLAPLPVPRLEASASELAALASVRLLVDRIQSVRPDFRLDASEAPSVAALVARLEGIPLALALAASRAQVLSPRQILERLGRLDLSSQQEDAPARHRSLRAAIEWSVRLLSREGQKFFARLSVFRGGFSLASAEAVCDPALALDRLAELRECSLVVAEPRGAELGFRLLETLREFGEEQLRPEEQDELRARHAEHFLAFAEKTAPLLNGPASAAGLETIARELDNVRAALEWSLTSASGAALALRLAVALRHFWMVRGAFKEGRHYLTRALERSPARTPERAKALLNAGNLAWQEGDYDGARPLFEGSLELAREQKDARAAAGALNNLGTLTASLGDFENAERTFEECAVIARELKDNRLLAGTLHNRGEIARRRGDHARACALLRESLALSRSVGDRPRTALSSNALAAALLDRGETREVGALVEEARSEFKALGMKLGDATIIRTLALLEEREQRLGTARDLYERALRELRDLGEKREVVACLEALSSIAIARGEPALARRAADEALSIARELRDRYSVGLLLARLGEAASLEGNRAAAQAHLASAVESLRASGPSLSLAHSLDSLALILRTDSPERAAALDRESSEVRALLSNRGGALA